MSETRATGEVVDVPIRVFEKFLADLETAGLPVEMVSRLRTTLLENRDFREDALKAAVLAEEPLR